MSEHQRQKITFNDILKVKEKLDAMDVCKPLIIEIRANSMTVDLILKDVTVDSYDENKDIAWGMIGFAPLGGVPVIKDDSIADYFVKVGEIWYQLNLGASGKVVSITKYINKSDGTK